jgi:hypothetical protein
MFQILGYYVSNNGLLTDMVAIPDSSFSARGGTAGNAHWIFTEQYSLMAIFGAGATITQLQLFDSTYNAINIPQVYPINEAITPLTNPNVMDLRQQPWPLPMNEEIAMQCSGGAGGAEPDYALIWIAPAGGGGMPAPAPNTLTTPRLYANVTATAVLTATAWSPFVPITFINPLKGGAYQINGAWWVVPHSLAYKHNFVKAPLYQGRKLFPGSLTENAYGNVPLRFGTMWMGPHGRFNNFELPQVSFLGTTSEGSATYNGILDLTYLGTTGVDAQP